MRPNKKIGRSPSYLDAAVLTLLCLSLSTGALALPEDRDEPITFQSDRIESDKKSGVTIYTGDVQVDQGTLHISADKVVIKVEDEHVRHIVASGDPARMRQRPSLEEEIVHASGATIRYDVTREILTLLNNASITQEETFVSSERIDYFLSEHRFQAQGSNSTAEDRERVIMVFPPKQLDEQLQKERDGNATGAESSEDL